MIRNGAIRALARNNLTSSTSNTRLFASHASAARLTTLSTSRALLKSPSLALAAHKPTTTALLRYATSVAGAGTPFDHIDKKKERILGQEHLEKDPEHVSSTSSVHQIFHEKGVEEPEKDVDMMAGVKADLKTIRETFSLESVPKEALFVGMAGVLPYLATSISTVYLAWDIQYANATGTGFLLSGQTAEMLLHIVEPLQIGYGAVIISFIGAIHWGLEWAKFGGVQGYNRYRIGVVAPAIAWPTILFPVEYALISQFLAFNYLYFVDARACAKGWTPGWYGIYRFVLTFIVGASIVISLIGRGQIADLVGKSSGPADRIKALREHQLENLQKEEMERRAKIVAKDEGEDDEE